jgi:FhaA, N-terminal domain/FHA domain
VVGALHRFEQRLEHMVTGAFARAFRSAVQPMEIAAALQREVDNSAQILSRDRRLAPNEFTIDLSVTDYERLSSYGQSLVSELASMMHTYAAEQAYVFAGPLQLNFHRAEDLTTGRFRVRSAAAAAVTPAPGRDPHPSDTAIRSAPMVLEIAGTRHRVEPPGVVVGRGSNAGLRIDDPGVSRRHAEFRVQSVGGTVQLSVADLGSTNGTTVNGQRVQHALLQDRSVVQVGSTKIVVRVGEQAGYEPQPRDQQGNPPHVSAPGEYPQHEYPQPPYPQGYRSPPDPWQEPPEAGSVERPWGQ